MSNTLIIIVVAIILFIIFYIPKILKSKQVARNNQKKLKHEASEKIMRPEIKLHEEEKKRWEDKYWKRRE